MIDKNFLRRKQKIIIKMGHRFFFNFNIILSSKSNLKKKKQQNFIIYKKLRGERF